MWNGKMKAFTLSYDDGVLQDKRFVEIINKYNLKCTFNINSGMLYNECLYVTNGVDVRRMTLEECKETFRGHEIAGHSLTHPSLPDLNDYLIEREIVGDKVNIENLFGCKTNGFVIPGGGNDPRIKEISKKFGIKYVRTVKTTESFDIPSDLYELNPTAHHANERLFELCDEFLKLKCDTPKMFYLWGHSYEFDVRKDWDRFEEFCEKISGKDDIFYGTNHDVLSLFYE